MAGTGQLAERVKEAIRPSTGAVYLHRVTAGVAEARRAQESVLASDLALQALIDSSPVPTIALDTAGVVWRWNPAAERLFGWSAAEVVGGGNPTLPESRATEYLHILEQARAGRHLHLETQRRRRNGESMDVTVSVAPILGSDGAVSRIVGFITDITERRRAEAALAERERHYRSLIENARDVIVTLDPSGEVTYISAAVQDVLGFAPSAVVGTSYLDWVHEEDRAVARERFAAAIAGVDDNEPMPIVRLRHADAGWRSLELTANLPHAGTAGASVIVTARDVTERLELETQLRQAQKMEAIGQLAGGIAHDFNNLLTAILGYGELLSSRIAAGSELSADLDEVMKAARRAAALTRQLLAFSRKQVLQPRKVSLNTVVAELEKMLTRVIGEDVEFRTTLAADIGLVSADVGQIEQVLLNLAVNARDAMPSGGVLTVETSQMAITEPFADGQARIEPGRWVRLAVADTGCGMTSDVLGRAFEPFFTTKERDRGTGLGLSTVYGIVKQSNGHIAVHSGVGRGTRFHIYLPEATPDTTAPESGGHHGVPSGTETVLLVEDDATIRRLLRAELQRHGYTVVDAANAAEALAAAAHHPSIDLLVSDIVMPGGNGVDLACALRETRPDMRILHVSGFALDSRHATLHPDTCFLPKPFTGIALARKVRECLNGAVARGDMQPATE